MNVQWKPLLAARSHGAVLMERGSAAILADGDATMVKLKGLPIDDGGEIDSAGYTMGDVDMTTGCNDAAETILHGA